MAKLSDNPDRKIAVEITLDRANDILTAAQAVVTSCTALKTGDVEGQFADQAAMDTAVVAVRGAYQAITIASLSDASAYFTIA